MKRFNQYQSTRKTEDPFAELSSYSLMDTQMLQVRGGDDPPGGNDADDQDDGFN